MSNRIDFTKLERCYEEMDMISESESGSKDEKPEMLYQGLTWGKINPRGPMIDAMNDTYKNWVGFNEETDKNLNEMIRYASLMTHFYGFTHESALALVEGRATYDIVYYGDGTHLLRVYDKRLAEEVHRYDESLEYMHEGLKYTVFKNPNDASE